MLGDNMHDQRKFWKYVKYILVNKPVQINRPFVFFPAF